MYSFGEAGFVKLKFVWLAAAMGVVAASGQVSNNQSLTGKYYFRQVLLITDGNIPIYPGLM